MKKIRLVYLLLLALQSSFVFSQSGEVTYAVIVDKNIDSAGSDIKGMIAKILENANKQKFLLTFNKNQSSFKLLNTIKQSDNYDMKLEKISRSAFTSRSNIFIDKEKKLILFDNSEGVIVKENFNEKNWEITKEKKLIDKYTCYKAIFNIEFLTRSGEKTSREIIAWFAPSLPYSYGPKNFYGLPGLILELTEKNTTYLVTKFQLLDKDIQITFPQGKTISREEYDNKLKKQMGM